MNSNGIVFGNYVLNNYATFILDSSGDGFFAVVIGFFLGLYLLYKGIKKFRKSQLIKNTPTEKVQSMAVGRTELEGVGKATDEPMDAPFTDDDCIFADWEVEEYKKRGDNRKWVTVASGTKVKPFILEDETGEVVVDATSSATWTIKDEDKWRTGGRSDPPNNHISQFCQSEAEISPTSRHRRRYTQEIIEPEETVYVLGEATPRDVDDDEIEVTDAGQRLKITRDDASGFFIISNKGEEALQSFYGKWGPIYTIGGLLLSAVCLYLILSYMGI